MSQQNNDPMDFLRTMWGGKGFTLPNMMTPTLDTEELNKRIKDLKTVEGWLRTNLSMLQMTIQNLEMQSTTLSAVKTMSQMYSDQAGAGSKTGKPGATAAGAARPATDAGKAAGDAAGNLAQAAMWPWNLMQQMQEQMQHASDVASSKAPTGKTDSAPATGARKTTERPTTSNGSATAAAAAHARRKPGDPA
jgi:hypothetical protein